MIAPDLAANTTALYRSGLTTHIAPRIGGIQLQKLTPIHVQSWLTAMELEKVGSRARQSAFQVLGRACRYAVEMEVLRKDPTAPIRQPAHEQERIQPFEPEEAQLLLAETAGMRDHAVYCLALMTGMRQGELLGLHWKHVDIARRTLFVCQQAVEVGGAISIKKPKTKSTIRNVELPEIVAAALEKHRAMLMSDGLAACQLVFPSPEGCVMGKTNFRRRSWNKLLLRAGLSHRGFHHTRHTYATLRLAQACRCTWCREFLGIPDPRSLQTSMPTPCGLSRSKQRRPSTDCFQ